MAKGCNLGRRQIERQVDQPDHMYRNVHLLTSNTAIVLGWKFADEALKWCVPVLDERVHLFCCLIIAYLMHDANQIDYVCLYAYVCVCEQSVRVQL